MSEHFEIGDTITIAGLNKLVQNPDRRWWQFWKPRLIDSGIAQTFTVTALR